MITRLGRRRPTGRRLLVALGALLVATLLAGAVLRSRRLEATRAADPALSRWLAAASDSLDGSLALLDSTLSDAGASRDASRLPAAFARSRTRYKHLEGALEFYAPALAAALNSRRQEVDDDDAPPPSSLSPGGFPALEPLLQRPITAAQADSARAVIRGMRTTGRQVRELAAALFPSDAQTVELARLEVARVSTLGIAGFDTPITHAAVLESADALDGLRSLFAQLAPPRSRELALERRRLDAALLAAARRLRANPDFESFDRLSFISGEAESVARAIDSIRRSSGSTPVGMLRAWRADVPSVYDAGAFDASAYAPGDAPASSEALVALGRQLFSEPALSGPGTRSCASCHLPGRAFTDGLARQAHLDGVHRVARHTPTLLNAALAPAQFADERAATLEEQVMRVLESPAEMGSSAARAGRTLAGRPEYRTAFAAAFGPSGEAQVTEARMRTALAAYVRSLVSLDSRFDRAVRGDSSALSPAERRGFTLFMGKAGCGTCHFAPLFSGNTPPLYRSSDVEVIGVPVSPDQPRALDPDSGRGGIDHLPPHVAAFKTPTVRNAAGTAPYMHNGAFRTLDQLLSFYDRGGGRGSGAAVPTQTLSPDSLHLTAAERLDIIAFIGSLTDTHAR